MKKNFLILGGIVLVMILLIARLVFVQNNDLIAEREWFARELRYEFSATIDSIRMFNGAAGNVRCRFTAGNPQVHREDSLKKLFTSHAMLYLIFHASADSIVFVLPYANQVRKGDSLRVSSADNTVKVYRESVLVTTQPLTQSLTGYGRSPFRSKD